MKKLNLTLSEELKRRIQFNQKDLERGSSHRSVVVISATLHHKTGERAYVLGYHPQREVPPDTLFDTGDMLIALFMDREEMSDFENAFLSWANGYVEMDNTSTT